MKKALAQIQRLSKRLFGRDSIFVLSDDLRAPNIGQLISQCPKDAKIIIRNPNIEEYSRFISKSNRSNILASIDPVTAKKPGIFGIHIPNKRIKYFRQSARGALFITASAHNLREICKAKNSGIKNIIISPIFKSESPSANNALGPISLGPIRLALMVRHFPRLNFIALGGINQKTIRRLGNIRISAIAGVSFRKSPLQREPP